MSDLLSVPTAFSDISELAEGLIDRVDEQRLILYGPDPFAENAAINFQVLLADGSAALAGTARVAASYDGGEERPPEARYDIVLDSLSLDGKSEVVHERILMMRDQGNEPPTGEVSLEGVEEQYASEGYPADAAMPTEDLAAEPAMEEWEDADEEGWAESPPAAEAAPPAAEAQYAPQDYPEAQPEAGYAQPEPGYEQGYQQPGAVGYEQPEAAAGYEQAGYVQPEAGYEQPAAAGYEQPEAGGYEQAAGGEYEQPAAAGGYEQPEAGGYEPPLGYGEEQVAEVAHEEAGWEVEGTSEVDIGDVEQIPESVAPPAMPDAPQVHRPATSFARTNGRALIRPSRGVSWSPSAVPRPEPRPSTGLFAYTPGNLPLPAYAPRPDLDPSLRVALAPRPDPAAEAASVGYGTEPGETVGFDTAHGVEEPHTVEQPIEDEPSVDSFAGYPEETPEDGVMEAPVYGGEMAAPDAMTVEAELGEIPMEQLPVDATDPTSALPETETQQVEMPEPQLDDFIDEEEPE